jgi:hypothetical protein
MKMRQLVYWMMIIMGAIIEIYDLKMDNPISAYFGGAAIAYGSFSIVVDYLKKKKKK